MTTTDQDLEEYANLDRDRVENDVVADLAIRAARPHELDPRGIYLYDGDVTDVANRRRDLDALPPLRKSGAYSFADPDDILEYLAKHASERTELWGNDKDGTVRAVIDAHGADEPDHEGHRAVLTLPFTRDWQEWIERDGKTCGQVEFAEFIEDHLPNFVDPAGADMLDLAQSFQATRSGEFASSQRLQSGETELHYTETIAASAGRRGTLAIPDTFAIGIQVYERGPAYRVDARFRYRINGGSLVLGYRLNRIDDVRRLAFDEVVERIEATGRQVWNTP